MKDSGGDGLSRSSAPVISSVMSLVFSSFVKRVSPTGAVRSAIKGSASVIRLCVSVVGPSESRVDGSSAVTMTLRFSRWSLRAARGSTRSSTSPLLGSIAKITLAMAAARATKPFAA